MLQPKLSMPSHLRWSLAARMGVGVKDLQEENCKLGIYNAEKGERGILSLQVRNGLSAWCTQCLSVHILPATSTPYNNLHNCLLKACLACPPESL